MASRCLTSIFERKQFTLITLLRLFSSCNWLGLTFFNLLCEATGIAPASADVSCTDRLGISGCARTPHSPATAQGFWKGVLPSLVMVCNPTVQYVLFEWLLARVRAARTKAGRKGAAVAPTGGQVRAITSEV